MNTRHEFTVRNDFKSGDIGQIIYLHGVLYQQEFGYNYRFEAYVAEYFGKFAKESDPKSRIWIADDGKEILGTIAIANNGNTVAQLRWFLVHPKARGQGIGKALMSQALAFCQQQGYKEVFLWTVKGLDQARKVYDTCGFILEEETTHETWGATRTEQRMRLVFPQSQPHNAINSENQ
jgi:GNAT superfamily N-acetyltransferase